MAIDLVCKMEVDEKTAKFKSEYKGTTYYFCSPLCRRTFNENPEEFIGKTQYKTVDPVCMMEVNEKTAQFTSEYQGTTYYFCSILCKRTFDELKSFLTRYEQFKHNV